MNVNCSIKHTKDHYERVRVYPLHLTPTADHPYLPSLPVSSIMTPTLFYEIKISTEVSLRRGEGFYEQELHYFVVIFESAD